MRSFNSKITLFGEYSFLLGSSALLVPFERFSGKLSFEKYSASQNSNNDINTLVNYLKTINNNLTYPLNISQLLEDTLKGLSFKSTIPMNYGLGSSAAISAAIYSNYNNNATLLENAKLNELRNDLAIIESAYHRKSAGIDPVCSLTNSPLIVSQTDTETVEINKKSDIDIFIIDTLQVGNKSLLISKFKQKWEDQGFVFNMMNEYIPLNNRCIDSFLNNDKSLADNIFDLSYYQHENFTEMIPPKIEPIWKEGLQRNMFSLKLCGSGGGGFMLGFTQNIQETMEYFMERVIPALLLKLPLET